METNINNNNEVHTSESTTPQNPSVETTAVVSDTSNYTLDTEQRQDSVQYDTINDNSKIPEFPLEDTDNYSDDYNIIRLNGMLHAYKNGFYTNDIEQIEANIYNTLKKSSDVSLEDIKKTIKTIQYQTKDHERIESPTNFIPFNNRILDTEDLSTKDFSPELIVTNKLGINFDEATINSANIEVINKVFKRIAPTPEMLQLLSKIIGACCFRSVDFPLALVFTGNLEHRRIALELLSRIGGNSISYESLSKLSNIKSSFALYSKTCNISDEVERPQIANMSNLRKIIQGKEIKDTKLFNTVFVK